MKGIHKFLIFLCVILFIGAIGFVGYSLKITYISYEGNSRYTEEELNLLIFDEVYSMNPFYLFFRNINGEKKQIPFIETYDIEFTNWNQIKVHIYEKGMVGYVEYKGYYMYFDKDGIVVESSREILESTVLITGLNFNHIILYEKLPVEKEEIFDLILNITQMISKHEIPADEIHFNSSMEITLYIGDIQVNMGKDTYLNEKIGKVKDLLYNLEGLSGTIHMEEFVEDTDTFWFKKEK